MKITNNNYNLSFKKELLAKGAYLQRDKSQPCYFYKLDPKEDKDYFKKLKNSYFWDCSILLDDVDNAFEEDMNTIREETNLFKNKYCTSDIYKDKRTDLDGFYVVENKSKTCIGIMEILSGGLAAIETCPRYANKLFNKDVKYVGESMICFLTKLMKEKKFENFVAPIILHFSKNFYERCHFTEEGKRSTTYYLKAEDFNKLIVQNKIHTKCGVELLDRNENN